MHNLRIVLVSTTHPGNIGATARAMKNMGLRQLYLVQPEQFPHHEATARASGADDLLSGAVVCDSLAEALAGCTLSVGLSARERHFDWPRLSLRDAARQAVSESSSATVALIFGRERTGLFNEELDLCNFLVHIQTDPGFSSLNVAAAVQLVCYELRMAWLEREGQGSDATDALPYATSDEVERLFAHHERVMIRTGFLDPDNPRQLRRRLHRLFNRARLEREEVQILRGFLNTIEKQLD